MKTGTSQRMMWEEEISLRDKIKKGLPYVVCACALLVLTVLNIFFYDHWLDSDMAAEMIFSKLLSEEGRIFATPNWYYSTEFRLVYTQLVMAPLFKLTGSFHVIRAVTNIVTYVAMLGAYFYMVRPLKIKRGLAVLTGTVLLLPFSETMMTHMQMGNTYMVHVIIIMLFFGMFLRLAEGGAKPARKIWMIAAYILTGVVCGISGVRYLLALQCPLVIASFIYFLKSEDFQLFRENFGESKFLGAYFKRAAKCPASFFLHYSLLGAAAAVIGYGINVTFVSGNYVFQTYEATNFIAIYQGILIERIQNAFGSLMMLFGYIPDRSVISLRGVVSLTAFMLLGCFLLIAVKTYKKCEGNRFFMALFFAAAFFFNTFAFVFATGTMVPRYYITVLVFALPLIAFYLEGKEYKFDKAAVACLLAFGFLLGSAKTTLSFVTADKNEDKRPVAEFLVQNGYDFGYATYWNANIITELTDGEVEVANILDPESLTFFTWSTPMKYYEEDYHAGRVFLLLTTEEAADYVDCKALLAGEKIFQDDSYIVYAYESTKTLLDCGEGSGREFR